MAEGFDLLLTGGTVLNPATGLHQQLDVAIGRLIQRRVESHPSVGKTLQGR